MCGSLRLATLQLSGNCRSALEWGQPDSPSLFWDVYRRIYARKSLFTAPLALSRKIKFPTVYIRRYTSKNENSEYSYPLNLRR